MHRQWLVNRPNCDAPAENLPNHPAFDDWRRYLGEITPGTGDYEHFVEEAFRLHASIRSFGADNVWIHHQWGEHRGSAFHVVTGEKRSAEELKLDGAGIYGAQPNTSMSHQIMTDPADDYAQLAAFQRNAGRYVEVGGFCSENEHDFERVFERMYDRGIRDVILKRRNRKYPLIEVDLRKWKSDGNVLHAVGDEDASWALINDEGASSAYLVQERVTMRYEYRSFVIGNKLVTGAGCVGENTPLNNSGNAFDDTVQEFRSSSTPERLPEVRDALLAFSRKVAKEIAAEAPEIDAYTLDTALDEHDHPLVIELNGHLNAGFYASQPQCITDALRDLQ